MSSTAFPGPAKGGSRAHLSNLRQAIDALDSDLAAIEGWGHRLAQSMAAGSRLLVAGNGGSAALALHLSGELLGRYRDERRPLSAICLAGDVAAGTAIANDYGYDQVFARQVRGHGRPGDVLMLMTTSGRSPNLIAGAAAARELGVTSWALTGPAPNPLSEACDETIAVSGPSTATVQEIHQVVVHLLCAALDAALSDSGALASRGGVAPGRVQGSRR
jgi:D-sedoheptulose 7-phosphate isomerase